MHHCKAHQVRTRLPTTVRRVLKKSGIIIYRKKRRKPILSGLQRAARVAWARNRLHWANKWKDIVFSDGPDNSAFYYHDIRKRELLHDKRHTGGGSVMVWAAIGWRGKSSIAFLDGSQDSLKYQQTLEEFLLPCAARIGGNRWIFMHDNASIHASASTRQWLADRHIRTQPWPARSPDLPPSASDRKRIPQCQVLCTRLEDNFRHATSSRRRFLLRGP